MSLTEKEMKEVCPQFWNVCIPCGLECNGLPCLREQTWRDDCSAEGVAKQILQVQRMVDERNRLNEMDEQFIKRQSLLYQKLTGQLEMTFDERLERAR